MPSKLEQCCGFLDSFKQITWTRTTVSICMMPFALLLLILVLLFLLSAEQPGAVVSNSLVCASVGKDILEEGGSAVDAAISTMLCEGIALPNSAGIGGGFTAVMYANGKFDSIVATPTVPLAVQNISNFDARYTEGPLSVGVPGELMGYWEMHKRYGVLSWKRLIQPSIDLCEHGVPITEWLAGVFRHNKERIVKSKTMGSIFGFADSDIVSAEQRLQFPTLAKTLRRIGNEGVSAFYHGDIGDDFISDLEMYGGIMTKQDLENYKVIWDDDPPSANLAGNFKVVTTPLPTSGAITILIMNVVKSLDLDADKRLFWHKTIEAMKHAFGHSSNLGDAVNDPEYRDHILKTYHKMLEPDFAREIRDLIKDDRVFLEPAYYGSTHAMHYVNGSANICISSPRGDAVAATSSILAEFGAFFASPSSGIIANNLLTRFINPKLAQLKMAPGNRPLPGKQMFSPYSPTIVLRRKTASPFFVVGASGGPKATTLVSTALIKYVLMATSAGEAVNFQYLHNQLYPNRVEYEEDFDDDILAYLEKIGHETAQRDTTYENFTAVTCIGQRLHNPDAEFNKRIGGSIALAHAKSDLNILLVIMIGGLAMSVVGLMLYEVLHPKTQQIILPFKHDDRHTEV